MHVAVYMWTAHRNKLYVYIYIHTVQQFMGIYGNMRTEGVTSYRYIWYNTRQWKSRVIWGSKPCTPGEYPNSSMSINMLITLLFSYVNIDQNTYYVLYIYMAVCQNLVPL